MWETSVKYEIELHENKSSFTLYEVRGSMTMLAVRFEVVIQK